MSEVEDGDKKKKIGRPSLKTPELIEEFCRRIASGRSVANVCKDDDMPEDRAIWRWLSDDEAFSRDYTRAIQARAMAHADMISDVTFGILSGKIPPDRGRVALDAMKWTASRLLPKIYGDRQHVDVDVQHTHMLHLDALRALSNRRPVNQLEYIDGQAIDVTHEIVDATVAEVGVGASDAVDPPGSHPGGGAALAPHTAIYTEENKTGDTPPPPVARKRRTRQKKREEI